MNSAPVFCCSTPSSFMSFGILLHISLGVGWGRLFSLISLISLSPLLTSLAWDGVFFYHFFVSPLPKSSTDWFFFLFFSNFKWIYFPWNIFPVTFEMMQTSRQISWPSFIDKMKLAKRIFPKSLNFYTSSSF